MVLLYSYLLCHMSVFIKLFNFAGPTDLKVSNMLPNGFTISFTAPLGNPVISDFIITVGDESKQDVCRLEKSETRRWCDFNYLRRQTQSIQSPSFVVWAVTAAAAHH